MIERYNVLELLGADKNKYHSCVITCYSFDFIFFEQRVLPILRHAGILNCTVFVDAKIFQHQVDELDGAYVQNISYSIITVPMRGAFHPKVIMAFGKNNGFLAVGSGNLTNSGLSNNDEVWGAFHTYKIESKVAALFKNAFQYLEAFEQYCYGVNKIKFPWIEKSSIWLAELKSIDFKGEVEITNEQTIKLLSSFANTSIYKQMIQDLPKEGLQTLTIISPYFNKTGQVLTQLLTDLNPRKVKVVVDSRFGTIPYQFENKSNVQFYDWQNTENSKKEAPRLHAKIFQFEYDKESYILTGSANASIEALGTLTTTSTNAEMGLFIKYKKAKNWIREMKINLPAKGDFKLEKYIPTLTDTVLNINNGYSVKIYHTEIDITELKINGKYLNTLTNDCSIVLLKKNGSVLKKQLTKTAEDHYLSETLNEIETKDVFKIYIVDKVENVISNASFVHNTQAILKTNPDDKTMRFFEIINSDTLPDNDLLELLEYAKFENIRPTFNSNSSNGITPLRITNQIEKEYAIVDETDFNKNEEIISTGTYGGANQISQLESFLDHLSFGTVAVENFADSGERIAEDAKEEGIDDDTFTVYEKVKPSYSNGLKLKNKLHKTLKEISDLISDKQEVVLLELAELQPLSKQISIHDINAVLIGIHLIFMKLNDVFTEERVKLKIGFSALKHIAEFEKTKGINLKRSPVQVEANLNEIIYNADASILTLITDIKKANKSLKFNYIDETPSIDIDHSYFSVNPITKNQYIYCTTQKGFLINSVAPFMLILINGNKGITNNDLSRFEIYKTRLFYRVSLLFISINWTSNEEKTIQLFLLNLFNTLLPKDSTTSTVQKSLTSLRNQSNILIKENTSSNLFYKNTLYNFLKWKRQFEKDKSVFLKTIESVDLGRIIYKQKFGFIRIKMLNKNTIDIETPLGDYNHLSDEFEIKNMINGTKALMY